MNARHCDGEERVGMRTELGKCLSGALDARARSDLHNLPKDLCISRVSSGMTTVKSRAV